jgi:hypothetical protein
MITFRITTDVKDDRRVVLTLPPEVPTGEADLIVTVERPTVEDKRSRTSLPDWAEAQAEPKDAKQSRYPLRGSVVRFEQPMEPVAEDDWEALR